MRVDYINNEIMEALLSGLTVRYADYSDGRFIFSQAGFVAYILQRHEIYFSLEKCQYRPGDFTGLLHDNPVAATDENKLLPTLDVRVNPRNKALLSRQIAAGWDTFVDMALLEAFDFPNLYQDRPVGAIAVTEGKAGTDEETLRGYVMPTHTGREKSGCYNDPLDDEED